MRSNPFRGFCLPVLFLVLFAVGPVAHAATNLLSNPDFELDTTGWADPFPDSTVISHDTSHDHDEAPGVVGSLKLEVSIDNNAADGPGQCVVVSPSETYLAAGAIFRPTQPAGADTPFPYIQVAYHSDATCTSHTGATVEGYLLGDLVDDWYEIEFETTSVPEAGSAYVRLFSGGTSDPTFTTVYFDNLYLPEPGTNLLATAAGAVLFVLGCLKNRKN